MTGIGESALTLEGVGIPISASKVGKSKNPRGVVDVADNGTCTVMTTGRNLLIGLTESSTLQERQQLCGLCSLCGCSRMPPPLIPSQLRPP